MRHPGGSRAIGLGRNPEMALNQEAIEKARWGCGRPGAQRTRQDALDFSAANMELLSAAYILPRQAEMSLTWRVGASYAEKGLRLSVEKSYYDVLRAKRTWPIKRQPWKGPGATPAGRSVSGRHGGKMM